MKLMKAASSPRWLLSLSLLSWSAAACGARPGQVAENPARETPAEARTPEPGAADNAPPADPFAKIPRVTVGELAAALKEGRAVAVDVRPAEAFAEERIPGAVSMPEGEVVERGRELPKDRLVVAYCA